ncbi:hypothetical protein PPYR_08553 [Photinus pyralis]|uniref:TGF-beta family profile domain-containing protein n=2 Tax=Photinus pyralis TaxID=7054 RepID=A0A1Y1LUV6_PHOPY|nr:protein 60A [Photinus pyralis]KAB0797560.1 hypothetical protein PPYR_08553 [Photinus pyralis]
MNSISMNGFSLNVYYFFISIYVCSAYSPAGLYIDNGLDQTIIDRAMSTQEKHEMELEILNLLGLPNRPRRGINAPLRKSAPRFLMDVYRSLMEKDEEGIGRVDRSADLYISGEEQTAIDESDVIMTFESSHHVSGVRHERGKRLWFNFTEVPIQNEIVGAELRIYQNNINNSMHSNVSYTVTAYQLINSEEGERELEYIIAVNTTEDFTGWLELNLTNSLSTWVAFPNSNKGLYLSVHPAEKPAREIRPEDIGLVTIKGDDETQPFMVAFLKATNHVKTRTSREIRRVRKTDYPTLMKNSGEVVATHDWRSCKINTLYISFKDLKWQDWIIAPDGYAAYYCAGECNFPLNSHMNATNHAIVQTLVHLMSPLKYPKPCCAPTKLTPISVLYFLDESNVILKKYKKMVVKSCGCH